MNLFLRYHTRSRDGLFLLAPDTGTLDAPAAVTNFGDKFGAELAKAKAGESTTEKPVTDKPAAVARKAETVAPKKETANAAPKSALDAALNGGDAKPADAPIVDEGEFEKQFPEDAKEKDFRKLRAYAHERDKAARELEKRLSKPPEPDPALTSQLDDLRKQLNERDTTLAEREAKLAEYNDAMTAVNLELHPDFRREFIEGRKALVQGVSVKLKNYGGDPEAISDALAMPEGKRRDAAVEEALSELSETARAKILRSITDIESLDERREKAMGNPQESFEKLQRTTLAQQQKAAQEAEQIKATEFERITRDLHKSVPTLALVDEKIEGGKEWNTAIKSAREEAYKLFAPDATFPDMVTTAIKGKDYDRITGLLIAERKETATLRAQLAEYDGAAPDIKGGKAPVKTKAEALREKEPGDRYHEIMKELSSAQDI